MTARDLAIPAASPRDRLRRHRRQALQAALLVIVPLAGVGSLLDAPGELAAIRLGGVALGWWAAGAGWVLALLALLLRPRALRR